MNRRRFIRAFGVLAGAVVVAPQVLAEIRFSRPLEPTDVLTRDMLRRAVKKLKAGVDERWIGGYMTVIGTLKTSVSPEEACRIPNYAECRKIVKLDEATKTIWISTRLSQMMRKRQYVHLVDWQGVYKQGWYRIRFKRRSGLIGWKTTYDPRPKTIKLVGG